jgi:hypothetical protein
MTRALAGFDKATFNGIDNAAIKLTTYADKHYTNV